MEKIIIDDENIFSFMAVIISIVTMLTDETPSALRGVRWGLT